MTTLEDIISILDMNEEVYIYSVCNEKALVFSGTLRDFPLETYLGGKDMNVTCMYPAVEEGDEDNIIPKAHLNIIVGGNYD